ncbi:MAG: deoxyribose-phosphate aldolase [Lachnospiraceae bacterium]|nr:deoxyribose-phosphate aldolase [Lachnospiraceae bacterium]
MDIKEMLTHIDHTQLKAFASYDDIKKLCDEALVYNTASVCIPPAYVADVKRDYGDRLKICTVIGFPLGYMTTAVKLFETADAVKNGADEIDMVINVGRLKAGEDDYVAEEIKAVRAACRGLILKVIVETCYLNEDEKKRICRIVSDCGADYIKTSTGFGTAGATADDIRLFKANIDPGVKMKAAGGIRTLSALREFLELGCERVGASATADFAKEAASEN